VSSVKYELGFYIPEDDILHSHRREPLRSYIVDFACSLTGVDVIPTAAVTRLFRPSHTSQKTITFKLTAVETSVLTGDESFAWFRCISPGLSDAAVICYVEPWEKMHSLMS
jgi:hypothetical protein